MPSAAQAAGSDGLESAARVGDARRICFLIPMSHCWSAAGRALFVCCCCSRLAHLRNNCVKIDADDGDQVRAAGRCMRASVVTFCFLMACSIMRSCRRVSAVWVLRNTPLLSERGTSCTACTLLVVIRQLSVDFAFMPAPEPATVSRTLAKSASDFVAVSRVLARLGEKLLDSR